MKRFLLGLFYWILQLTWGIVMNIIGLVVTLICLIGFKGKIHRNGYGFITEVGGNWGGLALGLFALCGSYSQENKDCYDLEWYNYTRKHEFGHSIQNMYMGPLFILLVGIPSAIRYWYDNIWGLQKDYEDIWFERGASKRGTEWIDWIEKRRKYLNDK